jgi:hypothetical protein
VRERIGRGQLPFAQIARDAAVKQVAFEHFQVVVLGDNIPFDEPMLLGDREAAKACLRPLVR